MEKVVASRFRLIKKIGAGSFGQIYVSEDIKTHKKVAVKLESTKNKSPQLSYESKLYNTFEGCCSVPRIYYFGTEERYNVMAIDLLGKSLEDLLNENKNRLSLKTVLMLADQMISSVEFIHNKNYLHRDIKPDNFVMGTGSNANKVYIIDFGLSKRYRDQFTHQHIPWINGKSLTGTARYASINTLRGIEQSRRDDMEALGYVWIYLLRGSLPWMGLKGKDQKHKYDKICEVKSKTNVEDLCRGFPAEFVQYFREIKKLRFTDKPNYSLYRQMFRSLFMDLGYLYDSVYDWTVKTSSKPSQGSSNKSSAVDHSFKDQNKSPMTRQIELPQNQSPYNQGSYGKDRSSDRKRRRTPTPVGSPAFDAKGVRDSNLDTKKQEEKDTIKRYDQFYTNRYEQSARRIFGTGETTTTRQYLKADTPRRKETTNDPRQLYGPPRVIRYTQLPRWMADAGNTVSRMRV
jgi:serine/threonine protein kinase